jgi:hypothetical protein
MTFVEFQFTPQLNVSHKYPAFIWFYLFQEDQGVFTSNWHKYGTYEKAKVN